MKNGGAMDHGAIKTEITPPLMATALPKFRLAVIAGGVSLRSQAPVTALYTCADPMFVA